MPSKDARGSCREVRDDLALHALGELPPERAAAVAAHLEACEDCAAAFDGQARLIELVKNAPSGPRRPDAAAGERRPEARRADVRRKEALAAGLAELRAARASESAQSESARRHRPASSRGLRRLLLLRPGFSGTRLKLAAAAAAALVVGLAVWASLPKRPGPTRTARRGTAGRSGRPALEGYERRFEADGQTSAPGRREAPGAARVRPGRFGLEGSPVNPAGGRSEGSSYSPEHLRAGVPEEPPADAAPAPPAAVALTPPQVPAPGLTPGVRAAPGRDAHAPTSEYGPTHSARLATVKGPVRCARRRSGTWFDAFEGLQLAPGDRLNTKDGMALLEFDMGGRAHVNTATVLGFSVTGDGDRVRYLVSLERGQVLIQDGGHDVGQDVGPAVHVETRDGLFSPVGTRYDVKSTAVLSILVVVEGEVLARAKPGGEGAQARTETEATAAEAAGEPDRGPVRVTAGRKCYVMAGARPDRPTHVDAARYVAWIERLRREPEPVREGFDGARLSAAMDVRPDVFDVKLEGGQLLVNLPPDARTGAPEGEWPGGMPFFTRESFVLADGLSISCDMYGDVPRNRHGTGASLAALCLYDVTDRDVTDRESAPRPRIVLRLDVSGGNTLIVQGRTHEHDIRLGRVPPRPAGQKLDRCELIVDDREIVAVVNGRRFGPFPWAIAPAPRVRAGAEANLVTGYAGEPVRFDNFWLRHGAPGKRGQRPDR